MTQKNIIPPILILSSRTICITQTEFNHYPKVITDTLFPVYSSHFILIYPNKNEITIPLNWWIWYFYSTDSISKKNLFKVSQWRGYKDLAIFFASTKLTRKYYG